MEKKGGGKEEEERRGERKRKKKSKGRTISTLSLSIRSSPSRSWSRNRGHLPQLSCPHPGVHFWCVEFRPRVRVRGYGSVVFQVLIIFPSLPATVDFSEASSSCSLHSVQVLELYSVGESG